MYSKYWTLHDITCNWEYLRRLHADCTRSALSASCRITMRYATRCLQDNAVLHVRCRKAQQDRAAAEEQAQLQLKRIKRLETCVLKFGRGGFAGKLAATLAEANALRKKLDTNVCGCTAAVRSVEARVQGGSPDAMPEGSQGPSAPCGDTAARSVSEDTDSECHDHASMRPPDVICHALDARSVVCVSHPGRATSNTSCSNVVSQTHTNAQEPLRGTPGGSQAECAALMRTIHELQRERDALLDHIVQSSEASAVMTSEVRPAAE